MVPRATPPDWTFWYAAAVDGRADRRAEDPLGAGIHRRAARRAEDDVEPAAVRGQVDHRAADSTVSRPLSPTIVRAALPLGSTTS